MSGLLPVYLGGMRLSTSEYSVGQVGGTGPARAGLAVNIPNVLDSANPVQLLVEITA